MAELKKGEWRQPLDQVVEPSRFNPALRGWNDHKTQITEAIGAEDLSYSRAINQASYSLNQFSHILNQASHSQSHASQSLD